MSVIRPTETARGTWLLGSHTGAKYHENQGADGGRSWAEPRFIMSNDGVHAEQWGAPIANLAYVDLLLDGGNAFLFVPHRFAQMTRLWFEEELLHRLPTKAQLA